MRINGYNLANRMTPAQPNVTRKEGRTCSRIPLSDTLWISHESQIRLDNGYRIIAIPVRR